MGKYTYTASLVDESISILKRADQELSGTSAAVLNAVNTILNARGADRLTMDFSDILDITDFARDDINAVTKEIINKQNEIEEYENAPWWKKLFASIGMALLKFFEGQAQSIEYMFDIVVSLFGFIGGIFNSDFRSACQEWADTNHVDNWFTQQYISEDGLFHWINSNSVFSYNSTAANWIEFGGSLIQSFGNLGLTTIGGAASLYKSFDGLIKSADTKAIVTAEPIVYPALEEVFEVEPKPEDEIVIKEEEKETPDEQTDSDDQFDSEDTDDDGDKEELVEVNDVKPQVLYGPPPIHPEQPIPGPTCGPHQVLYGPPPGPTDPPYTPENEIVTPQVLYGPPPVNPEDPTMEGHGGTGAGYVPKSGDDDFAKKSAGSFSDLISGGSTPVSPTTLSSKNNYDDTPKTAPLAAGGLAAGVAAIGTKALIDKRKGNKDDKDIKAEEWKEEDENAIDYEHGREKDAESDYLSPQDELAFLEE